MKYSIECMDEIGHWTLFNHFTGDIATVKQKCCDILMKTKYVGVRFHPKE